MQSKQELREYLLARRRAMAAAEAADKSGLICQRLMELLRQRLAGAASPLILSYLAYGREVRLDALHRELWRLGWRLAVPRTVGLEPGHMQAVIYEPETELEKTALGVLEPREGALCPPEELDAVLLPGVAFDGLGCRLGHGAGYYDRFLPKLRPGALLVGVAYEWQVLPVGGIPKAPWDQPCDWVVTEQRVIDVARERQKA